VWPWVLRSLSTHALSRESGIVGVAVCSAGVSTMIVLFKRLVGEIIRRELIDFILRPPRAEELRKRALRVLDELR
jgi:hypothetical protein